MTHKLATGGGDKVAPTLTRVWPRKTPTGEDLTTVLRIPPGLADRLSLLMRRDGDVVDRGPVHDVFAGSRHVDPRLTARRPGETARYRLYLPGVGTWSVMVAGSPAAITYAFLTETSVRDFKRTHRHRLASTGPTVAFYGVGAGVAPAPASKRRRQPIFLAHSPRGRAVAEAS